MLVRIKYSNIAVQDRILIIAWMFWHINLSYLPGKLAASTGLEQVLLKKKRERQTDWRPRSKLGRKLETDPDDPTYGGDFIITGEFGGTTDPDISPACDDGSQSGLHSAIALWIYPAKNEAVTRGRIADVLNGPIGPRIALEGVGHAAKGSQCEVIFHWLSRT